MCWFVFFFSSRRRHTRLQGDWSSDVCSSDLGLGEVDHRGLLRHRASGPTCDLPHNMQYCACIRKIVRTPPSVKHYIAWLVLTPTVYHSRPLQGNSMDQFETAAQSAGAADSLSEAPRNQVLQALGERVRRDRKS